MLKIRHNELVDLGSFIDLGGNDFWGVQVFQDGGHEYVAASDRDSGLTFWNTSEADRGSVRAAAWA